MTVPPTITQEDHTPTTELARPTGPPAETPPTTSAAPSRFGAALRSEVIKAASVRTNKAILVGAFVCSSLMSWATAAFYTEEVLTASKVFVFSTWLTSVLATVAGIVSFCNEVQHGTLAPAVAAQPTRWPIVAAKAVVAGGFGLLLAVTGLATGFAGAIVGGVEVGPTGAMPATVGWALLYVVGSALLGLGVGMVVRHGAGAVSGVLVWWFVIEGLALQFAPVQVVRYLPFDAGFRTLGVGPSFDSQEFLASALANWLNAVIFWAYVVAALALGTALFLRRDID